jgi:hypothetical protein
MLAQEACLARLLSTELDLSDATNTPTEALAALILLRKVIKKSHVSLHSCCLPSITSLVRPVGLSNSVFWHFTPDYFTCMIHASLPSDEF